MTEALTITITSAAVWPFIGKLAVSALIAYVVGGIGMLACMDDDSWPNQVFRAVFLLIAAALIFCVWVFL